MKKNAIEIKWALLLVIFMLAWAFFERILGLHDQYLALHPIVSNAFGLVVCLIYILAIRQKKRKYYAGNMNFQQGVFTGMRITALIVILSPVVQYVIYTFITPDFFKNVIAYTLNKGKMSEGDTMQYFNMKNYMIQSAIGFFALGVMTSIVVSIFTRSETDQG